MASKSSFFAAGAATVLRSRAGGTGAIPASARRPADAPRGCTGKLSNALRSAAPGAVRSYLCSMRGGAKFPGAFDDDRVNTPRGIFAKFSKLFVHVPRASPVCLIVSPARADRALCGRIRIVTAAERQHAQDVSPLADAEDRRRHRNYLTKIRKTRAGDRSERGCIIVHVEINVARASARLFDCRFLASSDVDHDELKEAFQYFVSSWERGEHDLKLEPKTGGSAT
jgi:hypothetical protein